MRQVRAPPSRPRPRATRRRPSDAEAKAIEGDLALDQHTYPGPRPASRKPARPTRARSAPPVRRGGLRAAREQAETASQQGPRPARRRPAERGQLRRAEVDHRAGQGGERPERARPAGLPRRGPCSPRRGASIRRRPRTPGSPRGPKPSRRRARPRSSASGRPSPPPGAPPRRPLPPARRGDFAKAAAAEQGGTEALARQAFADALGRFHAAEQGYQEAARLAGEAASPRGHAPRRQSGPSAGPGGRRRPRPGHLRRGRVGAAQAKESAGQSALGREDYVTARRSSPRRSASTRRRHASPGRGRGGGQAQDRARRGDRLRQAVATARRAAGRPAPRSRRPRVRGRPGGRAGRRGRVRPGGVR
jgi:hypothetical protein